MGKRALLVGINYTGTPDELHGSITDINAMRDLLVGHEGYNVRDIVILTDETAVKPIKANIINYLTTFASSCKPGDTCFFHFSGHGLRVVNGSGMYDDAIAPLDFRSTGLILADDLRAILLPRIPSGARFIGMLDSCNSGNGFDLRYVVTNALTSLQLGIPGTSYNIDEYTLFPSSNGDIILLSACQDDQLAAEFPVGGVVEGELTYAMMQCVPTFGYNPSYRDLLTSVRQYIVTNKLYPQTPQLAFGKLTDLNGKFF